MKSIKKDNKYDVIVIGGGPAGSTAAYLLNKGGLNVLLLEKEKFPRSKLCGGLLTKKTIDLISDIYDVNLDDLIKEDVINNTVDSYQVYYKDEFLTENNLKEQFNLVKREVFDNYLLNIVKKSGVKVLEKMRVKNINFEKNTVYTDQNNKYAAQYIIAADGANSIVKKKILKQKEVNYIEKINNNQAISYETEINKNKVEFDFKKPRLYFGIINWGYGWIFPKSDTITIGLGGLQSKNRDLKKSFKEFIKLIGLNNIVLNYKGWILPFGNDLKRPIYKKVILIGDAANFVDPLTGEGIYYAHKSAQLAADIMVKRMKNNTNFELKYIKKINREIKKDFKKAKLYRNFLWSTPQALQKLLVKISAKYLHLKISEMIQGYR